MDKFRFENEIGADLRDKVKDLAHCEDGQIIFQFTTLWKVLHF